MLVRPRSIISERKSLETAYYGKSLKLEDIVLMDMVSNKGAAALLGTPPVPGRAGKPFGRSI